ncbi:hypothetical protein KGM_208246 [Danaus plexippus plexippus]|uniref:FLYWCH-type domain-containing protein n=1 Tax=Danaus plexippus plexippus TaxID=278856 RepID=A0A212FGY7_DANPL|nr:hypothetical protein KGM_208246 [Danaus plexippus plexippus]
MQIGKYRLRKYSRCSGATYTLSRYGKPVMEVDGYRYNQKTGMGPKKRWVCVKERSAGSQFLTSRTGRPVIQIGPYRFNLWSGSQGKPRMRWICVKVHSGCQATLITCEDTIVKQRPHNH